MAHYRVKITDNYDIELLEDDDTIININTFVPNTISCNYFDIDSKHDYLLLKQPGIKDEDTTISNTINEYRNRIDKTHFVLFPKKTIDPYYNGKKDEKGDEYTSIDSIKDNNYYNDTVTVLNLTDSTETTMLFSAFITDILNFLPIDNTTVPVPPNVLKACSLKHRLYQYMGIYDIWDMKRQFPSAGNSVSFHIDSASSNRSLKNVANVCDNTGKTELNIDFRLPLPKPPAPALDPFNIENNFSFLFFGDLQIIRDFNNIDTEKIVKGFQNTREEVIDIMLYGKLSTTKCIDETNTDGTTNPLIVAKHDKLFKLYNYSICALNIFWQLTLSYVHIYLKLNSTNDSTKRELYDKAIKNLRHWVFTGVVFKPSTPHTPDFHGMFYRTCSTDDKNIQYIAHDFLKNCHLLNPANPTLDAVMTVAISSYLYFDVSQSGCANSINIIGGKAESRGGGTSNFIDNFTIFNDTTPDERTIKIYMFRILKFSGDVSHKLAALLYKKIFKSRQNFNTMTFCVTTTDRPLLSSFYIDNIPGIITNSNSVFLKKLNFSPTIEILLKNNIMMGFYLPTIKRHNIFDYLNDSFNNIYKKIKYIKEYFEYTDKININRKINKFNDKNKQLIQILKNKYGDTYIGKLKIELYKEIMVIYFIYFSFFTFEITQAEKDRIFNIAGANFTGINDILTKFPSLGDFIIQPAPPASEKINGIVLLSNLINKGIDFNILQDPKFLGFETKQPITYIENKQIKPIPKIISSYISSFPDIFIDININQVIASVDMITQFKKLVESFKVFYYNNISISGMFDTLYDEFIKALKITEQLGGKHNLVPPLDFPGFTNSDDLEKSLTHYNKYYKEYTPLDDDLLILFKSIEHFYHYNSDPYITDLSNKKFKIIQQEDNYANLDLDPQNLVNILASKGRDLIKYGYGNKINNLFVYTNSELHLSESITNYTLNNVYELFGNNITYAIKNTYFAVFKILELVVVNIDLVGSVPNIGVNTIPYKNPGFYLSIKYENNAKLYAKPLHFFENFNTKSLTKDPSNWCYNMGVIFNNFIDYISNINKLFIMDKYDCGNTFISDLFNSYNTKVVVYLSLFFFSCSYNNKIYTNICEILNLYTKYTNKYIIRSGKYGTKFRQDIDKDSVIFHTDNIVTKDNINLADNNMINTVGLFTLIPNDTRLNARSYDPTIPGIGLCFISDISLMEKYISLKNTLVVFINNYITQYPGLGNDIYRSIEFN